MYANIIHTYKYQNGLISTLVLSRLIILILIIYFFYLYTITDCPNATPMSELRMYFKFISYYYEFET